MRKHSVLRAMLLAGCCATVPFMSNCKELDKVETPSEPACASDPAAVADLGLTAGLEERLKAAITTGVRISELAAKVENDVAAACNGVARDLGAKDYDLGSKTEKPGKKAEMACKAAVELLEDFKAQVGGGLSVDARAPRCDTGLSAYADCAASCDTALLPGETNMSCEEGKLSGSCEGKCQGKCNVASTLNCEGTCEGTCKGSCEEGFSGSCGGTCDGTCNGESSAGPCKGTCEGKCSGKADGKCFGSCKGECSGGCEMEAKGECQGTCSGSCSGEMKAPRCEAILTPPEMSAECEAQCDADLAASVKCSEPAVSVVVYGLVKPEAATKLKSALYTHLPALLKIHLGMKAVLEEALTGAEATLKGVQSSIKADAKSKVKAGACIAAALKAQAKASVGLSASFEASASVAGAVSVN